jgi:hypothetical protein
MGFLMKRNLESVAKDWWGRSLQGDRLTGREAQDDYDLDEQQFNSVKRLIRRKAKDHGIGWGYLPETKRYVLVDTLGQSAVAKSVIRYQLRLWQSEGMSADLTVSAFARLGYVSETFEEQVHGMASEFDARIDGLADEIPVVDDDEDDQEDE